MNTDNLTYQLLKSWKTDSGICSVAELKDWIYTLNMTTKINIAETKIDSDSAWIFDEEKGCISNQKKAFFSVKGMRYYVDNKLVEEQPIIIQDEIGFLGIIAKEIDNNLYFLMQAKIEPGNVNGVQISPTIQATKSNFTCAHGGNVPLYLDWFKNISDNTTVLYDQIQSEQGNRFIGKRNRNIIILIKDNIEIYPNFRWMTLGQIKELMKDDNLVNMDSRTVLSGLLTILNIKDKEIIEQEILDKALGASILAHDDSAKAISLLNNYKMFHDIRKEYVNLRQLKNWTVNSCGVFCDNSDFDVKYYNIEIEGREVKKWQQPLFKAKSKALFVLFTRINNGTREFLIKLCPEIGCFDKAEFGPSIQIANYQSCNNKENTLFDIFSKYERSKNNIIADVVLSEEGGRFYHEENRNMIVEIDDNDIPKTNQDYIWVNYATLNSLIKSNNILNIQLRNLLSLLPIDNVRNKND